MSNYRLSKSSLERLRGVNPDLISVIYRALEISKVDFGIPKYGGLRTPEEQNYLYLKGKSKADGYKKISAHQSGDAFDIYAYVDCKATWRKAHLTSVACAILQASSELGVRLQWGGHWKSFADMPHFEVKK